MKHGSDDMLIGPVIVSLGWPAGTKQFLKTVLCKPDASI
jgi:hypothetical protein